MSLKEKKKEYNNKKKKKLFSFKVDVYDNEELRVAGPINDPVLILKILAGAMNVIVDHQSSPQKHNEDIQAEKEKKGESKIVTLN